MYTRKLKKQKSFLVLEFLLYKYNIPYARTPAAADRPPCHAPRQHTEYVQHIIIKPAYFKFRYPSFCIKHGPDRHFHTFHYRPIIALLACGYGVCRQVKRPKTPSNRPHSPPKSRPKNSFPTFGNIYFIPQGAHRCHARNRPHRHPTSRLLDI